MPEFPPWNADADVKVDADAEDSALSISLVSHWRQQTGKIPAAPRRLDADRKEAPPLADYRARGPEMIIPRDVAIVATPPGGLAGWLIIPNGPWDGF